MKKLMVLVFIFCALFVSNIAHSTDYLKTATYISSPLGWTIARFTHTFVATTDTAYFLMVSGHPTSNYADTLQQVFNAKVVPLSDSSSVEWQIWTASDTVGWGLNNHTLWKKYSVAADSNATTATYRTVIMGSPSYGGWQPYIMFVGIGKTSGGIKNEVGNVIKLDAFKP